MPISASRSLLKTQLEASLSLDVAASISTTADAISLAVATASSLGLIPKGSTMAPLVPSGLSSGKAMILTALSAGPGATIKSTALNMAQGISVIAPDAPPAGLSTLISDMEAALSAGEGAAISDVADQFATAIVNYYVAGGVS